MSARIIRSLGYEVLVAGTAEEAISFCGDPDTAIDLLVTDVVMPGTNGPELDRKIRELKPGIATLFMSGYTSNVIVHHGVLDEGIHFLHKPFRRIDLAREIREALGGD